MKLRLNEMCFWIASVALLPITATAATGKQSLKNSKRAPAMVKPVVVAKEATATTQPAAQDEIKSSAAAPAAALDIAAPSSVAEVDTATEDQSILSKLSVNYTVVGWGPSIQGGVMRPADDYGNTPAPSADNMPTNLSNMTAQMYTENAIGPSYKLSKTVSVSGAANFLFTPVRGEPNAIILDPTLRISNSSLLSAGDFAMNGDFRIYPGITGPSTAVGKIAQFRSVQNPNYTLGRWNFALGLQERYYIYDNSGAGRASQGEGKETEGGYRYRLYTGPQVTYNLNDKLGGWILYEMEAANRYANGFFDLSNNGTDTEIGVTWSPLKQLTVIPFLDFKTGGKISAETTTLNLVLTGRLI